MGALRFRGAAATGRGCECRSARWPSSSRFCSSTRSSCACSICRVSSTVGMAALRRLRRPSQPSPRPGDVTPRTRTGRYVRGTAPRSSDAPPTASKAGCRLRGASRGGGWRPTSGGVVSSELTQPPRASQTQRYASLRCELSVRCCTKVARHRRLAPAMQHCSRRKPSANSSPEPLYPLPCEGCLCLCQRPSCGLRVENLLGRHTAALHAGLAIESHERLLARAAFSPCPSLLLAHQNPPAVCQTEHNRRSDRATLQCRDYRQHQRCAPPLLLTCMHCGTR